MKRIETTIAFNMATRVCGYLMEESTDWMRYILAKDRSVEILPLGLPAGIFQAVHAIVIEVVSHGETEVERRLPVMGQHRRGDLLLFLTPRSEVAKSHHPDTVLLRSRETGRGYTKKCR
jgi:hypothetical protein